MEGGPNKLQLFLMKAINQVGFNGGPNLRRFYNLLCSWKKKKPRSSFVLGEVKSANYFLTTKERKKINKSQSINWSILV